MEDKRRPGDLILERYLPDADDETRARARENLRIFAKALLRIAIRQTREELAVQDSLKSREGAILSKAP